MPSAEDYVSQMRAALGLTEPGLDTTVGSVTRKILDAVGEGLAQATIDSYLVSYQYDLDAAAGTALEDIVRMFGFTRLPARRATGTVTFERTNASTRVVIPMSTQVSTSGASPVVVVTATAAAMNVGDFSVEVPASAMVAGSAGNIAAQAIDRAVGTFAGGITGFTNLAGFSGGADPESDEQLRTRFRRTAFRSMAGTESQYLGTALENPFVTQANVVGASKRRREQVEIVLGEATSTLEWAASIIPGSSVFGEDIDNGEVLKEGVVYDFDDTVVPPTITVIDGGIAPDGVYDLEFDYVPLASRNDLDAGITNRIDLWTNGFDFVEATETLVFSDDRVFQSTTPGADWYTGDFARLDEAPPEADNLFIPYSFCPVYDPSTEDSLTIDGNTYDEGTDYHLIMDTTAYGDAPHSWSGIEWVVAANGGAVDQPAIGSAFPVVYSYNQVPGQIERAIQAWRILSTDVWVHQARPIILKLNLSVITRPGTDLGAIKTEMMAVVRDLLDRVGFDNVLQASDVLAAAHGVAGVDSVRFTTSDEDPVHYAMQRYNRVDGLMETYHIDGRARDVATDDDSYFFLSDINLRRMAQNTLWST